MDLQNISYSQYCDAIDTIHEKWISQSSLFLRYHRQEKLMNCLQNQRGIKNIIGIKSNCQQFSQNQMKKFQNLHKIFKENLGAAQKQAKNCLEQLKTISHSHKAPCLKIFEKKIENDFNTFLKSVQ